MDLAERAYAAMSRVIAAPAEKQIVVTHGGTVTLLLAAWIGMPIESAGRVHLRTSLGGITELSKNSRNHSHAVVHLDDVEHLPTVSGQRAHE